MRRRRDEKGFALIAALLANLILLAVGIVALNLSTGDLRISMRAVGDKKAVNAAEAGLHWLTVNFDAATYTTLISVNPPYCRKQRGRQHALQDRQHRGAHDGARPDPPAGLLHRRVPDLGAGPVRCADHG